MAEPPKHRIGYEDTLNLVTSLCLTYTLVVAGLRAWVRRGLNGMDDAVILLAVVLAIGLFASNYIALGDGAAKTWLWISEHGDIPGLSSVRVIPMPSMPLPNALTRAADCHVWCCLLCAVALRLQMRRHLLHVAPDKGFSTDPHLPHLHGIRGRSWTRIRTARDSRMARELWLLLGLRPQLGILLVTGECDTASRSSFSTNISLQSSRWIAFTVLDIVTELLLVALPLYQVWDLQMPLKRKLIVIAAFNLRLPVIGLSIGRMVYTQRLCDSTTDFGLGSGLVIIWLTIETSFAIVSNTFAALRAFTMSFNSTFGLGFVANAGSESYTMFQYRGNKNSAAYASHIKRTASAPRSNVPADPRAFKTQPEDIGRSYTSVSANRVGQTRAEEWKRDRTMDDHGIMRETEYSVVMDDQDMVRHSETGGDEIPIVQGSRR